MTRSIIALGISCFQSLDVQENAETGKKWKLKVCTFNISLLCSEDYIVEPAALKFLVEHGFDFVKQYSKGLPYYRGRDKVNFFGFYFYVPNF